MPTQLTLSRILLKTLGVIFLGSAIGLTYNALSPGGIALKGDWSPKVNSNSLVVPYGYEEDIDPLAVNLDYVMMKFQSKNTVFLDSRYPEDFKAGHIKGAINLPCEEFEEHAPQVLLKLPPDREIITYCDGTECETSLLLARELLELGYEDVKVFFGGWHEWKRSGLSVETDN